MPDGSAQMGAKSLQVLLDNIQSTISAPTHSSLRSGASTMPASPSTPDDGGQASDEDVGMPTPAEISEMRAALHPTAGRRLTKKQRSEAYTETQVEI